MEPIRHSELSPQLEERIRQFEPVFAEVYPKTHDEWLESFRREIHPDKQVAIWESMAAAFKALVEKHELSTEARQEAFGFLLQRATDSNVLSKAELRYLSRGEAEELLNLYARAAPPR